MELLWAIALGVTLAAAAGFRAFLPLFVLGVMQRYDLMAGHTLGAGFDWLSSDTAMAALSVATVVEVVADKVPAVDHALDTIMTFLRPAAGYLSVFAVLSPQDPVMAYVGAMVLAGGATLPIHLGKSALRFGANVVTGGASAPVLSAAEDLSTTLSVVLAVLVPICAVLFGLSALALTFYVWRRRRRRRS